MLADQPMLHDAITACLINVMIGSLVWMFVYCRGSLKRVYATEPTGSGPVLDFLGNALITLLLIASWPVMLIGLLKGRLH